MQMSSAHRASPLHGNVVPGSRDYQIIRATAPALLGGGGAGDEPAAAAPFTPYITASISLVDHVPEGGGFVCVPGSHRRNFAPPDSLTVDSPAPWCVSSFCLFSQQNCGEATTVALTFAGVPRLRAISPAKGDLLVFTECLWQAATARALVMASGLCIHFRL